MLETQLPEEVTTQLNGHLPSVTDIDEIPVVPIKPSPKQPEVRPSTVVRPVPAGETETVIPVIQRGD